MHVENHTLILHILQLVVVVIAIILVSFGWHALYDHGIYNVILLDIADQVLSKDSEVLSILFDLIGNLSLPPFEFDLRLFNSWEILDHFVCESLLSQCLNFVFILLANSLNKVIELICENLLHKLVT